MGEIIPSKTNEIIYDNTCKDPKAGFKALADIYLSKDSGRTEQLNTANAIIASTLCTLTEPPPDFRSLEECQNAVIKYFQSCAEKNVRPAISGICVALGITRRQFIQACESGQLSPRYADVTIALPNDVWEFFTNLRSNYAAMIESFLETNLIHPTAGMFLLKNNCGYQDEIVHNYEITKRVFDVGALAEKYAKELESGEDA